MSTVAAPARERILEAGRPSAPGGARRRWSRFILPTYSTLILVYLVVPIAVMILYSFNQVRTPLPQVSFAWNGATARWYREWNQIPGLTPAFFLSIKLALVTSVVATIMGTAAIGEAVTA